LEEIAMLKKILIGLAVLILGFVVVVALQPSEFQMERSTKIAAPAADIFPLVNDFHKWDSWSPWAKLDPNAKIGFEGPPEGEGAIMTWSGNSEVGEGKMTLTESRPNELIKTRVDIVKPFAGSSTADFTFKPDGDQTAVTWSVAAHHNFLEKGLCLIFGGKRMMSGLMDKGLAQMKAAVESKPSASVN
jgi:polyketide cyclase/dehydrase/lipid transport protein